MPRAKGDPKIWILHHSHRHGDSIWPVISRNRPDTQTIAASDPHTFELNRDDETLTVSGPFPLSQIERLS